MTAPMDNSAAAEPMEQLRELIADALLDLEDSIVPYGEGKRERHRPAQLRRADVVLAALGAYGHHAVCNAEVAALEAERDSLAQLTGDGIAPFVRSQVALKARVAELEGLLREVIARHWEKGHPGRPCVRTGWINVEQLERWRAVLDDNTDGVANRPEATG